jgi:hypothetical protein
MSGCGRLQSTRHYAGAPGRATVTPAMQALVRVFWDIALWRRGPRDVPPSWALFALVAVLYVTTSAAQSLLIYGPTLAWGRGLADLGLTSVVFGACLAVGRRTNRLLQTLTAVLGTGALLALPMIGILLLGQQLGPDGPLALLLSLVSLPILVWYLFIVGNIVRLALEAPLLTGMAVAMTYFVLSYAALVRLPQATGG